MVQEAPADTAGPSSPPPKLPDGWLPQWEGVQRKWYFVQRATGKSQWEIPTEPVVLSPSTTPTSIGTGPSQAPLSRPSTNSPEVKGNTDTMSGHIESMTGSAKYSSSVGAQVNGRVENLQYGFSGMPYKPSSQSNQQKVHQFGHYNPSNQRGFELGPPNQSSANVGDGIFTLDPASAHSVYAMRQQGLTQGVSRPHWGNNTEASTGNMSQFEPENYISSFQKPNVNSHSWQQASMEYPSRTTSQSQVRVGSSPTQPQWQLGQPSISPHATTTSFGPSVNSLRASEPSCGSYPTTQSTGELIKDFPAQSSQYSGPSLPHNGSFAARKGLQTTQPSFPAHSHGGMDFSHSTTNRQTSLCDSHQGTAFQQAPAPGPVGQPFQHAYPSHPFVAKEDRYGNAMASIHSGAGFNSTVNPVFVENQAGIQHFQNPLVQAGVQQYLPPHLPNPVGWTSGYLGDEHLYNHHSQQGNTRHRLSQVAASNPQFVSGPWGSSTPPTSGPMEPAHYH